MTIPDERGLQSGNAITYTTVAAIIVVSLIAGLLIQIGSPMRFVALFMVTFVVSIYLFVGIAAHATGMEDFEGRRQAFSKGVVSQAITGGTVGAAIYILLAGQFYQSGTGGFASYWGWLVGIFLATALFSAFLGRNGGSTLASLFDHHSEAGSIRFVVILVSLICSAFLLLFQLEVVVMLSESSLYMSREAIVYATCISVGFCALAGGLNSITLARQIAFTLMLICFLLPLVWIAIKTTGIPLPQIALGYGAIGPVNEINTELLDAGISERNMLFDMARESAGVSVFSHIATVICLGCGLAAMPHILQHFSSMQSGKDARRSGYFSFWMLLVFLSAVPAVAAFVKFDLYTSLLGFRVGDLEEEASWLFALSGAGRANFISICGTFVVTAEQAIAACGKGPEHFLTLEDIGLNMDLLALVSPLLHQLPPLVSAIFATGALIAIFSTIDGILVNMGLTISNDVYRRTFRPKAPKSVRLFMTRVFVLVIVMLIGYIAINYKLDGKLLFESAFALAAASLFPALVALVWLPGSKPLLQTFATLSGLAVTSALVVLANFGSDLIQSSGDELLVPWMLVNGKPSGLVFGTVGMATSFTILILATWLSPILKPEREKRKGTDRATA